MISGKVSTPNGINLDNGIIVFGQLNINLQVVTAAGVSTQERVVSAEVRIFANAESMNQGGYPAYTSTEVFKYDAGADPVDLLIEKCKADFILA